VQQTIMLGSSVRCTDGSTGSVSRIVVNPATNQLEYIVVHRGLFGGHDHCVPAGSLAGAAPDAVTLNMTTADLKGLPELEIHVPGEGTLQRSIPETCAALHKGTIIKDETGTTVGHFSGVVVSPERQIERFLLTEDRETGIPIAQLIECCEDDLTVRLAQQTA
jgi:hypothetical protein